MANKTGEHIKLGLFVSAGMLVLILSLYFIGKNQNMFGSTFMLRAHFRNVNGLTAGNNVRFAGIQAGTVSKITVLNDTTIEIELLVQTKLKPHIGSHASVSIGNEGLMGNKVVNIIPSGQLDEEVKEGALLATQQVPGTDEMLSTLSYTNDNVQTISQNLIYTVYKLNNSRALWAILNDTDLPRDIHLSVAHIRSTAERLDSIAAILQVIATDTKSGRGVAGALLANDSVARQLRETINNLSTLSQRTTHLVNNIDSIATHTGKDLQTNGGLAQRLMKDTAMAGHLNRSIINLENGTAGFNENMEALKHNFLLKKYFKKQQKAAKKKQ